VVILYLLLGGVIELVLASTAEALLQAKVLPQSLHDISHLRTEVAVVGARQWKQLARIVLAHQHTGRSKVTSYLDYTVDMRAVSFKHSLLSVDVDVCIYTCVAVSESL